MSNLNNKLSVKKCLSFVDLIDIYLTKNILKLIKNKEFIEFIKKNIFLLTVTNKNNKNSLMILLENGKYEIINNFIEYDYKILDYKNVHENNLLKLLLAYDYFYDYIYNYIIKYDKDFIIKILTDYNNQYINFIDNLIMLINLGCEFYNYNNDKLINSNLFSNDNLINKILKIAKQIYLFENEEKILILTKLCKLIKNENYLIKILKYFDINNIDIYPDENMLYCIDYLILNEYFNTMEYFVEKINYIEFINIDDNLIFNFLQNTQIDIKLKSKIILEIISKSNISKFKNNKNQNIFYFLIKDFGININIIIKFIDLINIYEQDIYGKSLFDLILETFEKKDLKILNLILDNKKLSINYYNNYEKINKKINIKNKLIKSDIGIFTSNIIHNMLYTVNVLNENKEFLTIPFFKQSEYYKAEQDKLLNISNNEKNILSYLKLYFNNFNTWIPHLILWKNKNNYWIDPNLVELIKKKKNINFIYIKLSLYLLDNTNTRHSNCIIVDNVKKTIERFEPYGEMFYNNSNDINLIINNKLAKPLGYTFYFVQPYPGFQSRSDEFAKHNKSYGDPMGFCLAWSFLYIYIKLELFKIKSDINPIDFINWYIINKFEKDFNINPKENNTNKYILFIRYFALYLDKNKNLLIKKYGLIPGLSYKNDLDIIYHDKIILNINKDLEKICK